VCMSGGTHQPGAHEDDGVSELWEGNSSKEPHHRPLNLKTYNFLTTWSRGLFEKLSAPQVVMKIPTMYGASKFFSVLTSSPQSTLSSAR